MIRESGGDRSAVTGGTKVLSDRIVVRITAERGQTFLDRMITLVEGANRQKTPNEIALTILLAVLTIVFLPVVVVAAAVRPLRRGHGLGRHPGRAAGVPHPDDHRGSSVGHRHRRHGPPRPAQRAGHERPGRRGGRRRPDPAARQDRHDHPRQPHGFGVHPGGRARRARGGRCRAAGLAGRRDTRGPLDRGAGQGALRHPRARPRRATTHSSPSPPPPGCRVSTSAAGRSARAPPRR